MEEGNDSTNQNIRILEALLNAQGDPWCFPRVTRQSGQLPKVQSELLKSLSEVSGVMLDTKTMRSRLGSIFGGYESVTKGVVVFERAILVSGIHGMSFDAFVDARRAASGAAADDPDASRKWSRGRFDQEAPTDRRSFFSTFETSPRVYRCHPLSLGTIWGYW